MHKMNVDDKIREIMNVDNYRYNCSIENFIMDEYSICREERQYAVFLYNILRKYGKSQSRKKLSGEEKNNILKIFGACGIEADSDIEHVFYEATFMRDFFERERRYYAAKQYEASQDKIEDKLRQKTYVNDTKWEDICEDEARESFNYKLIKYVHNNKDIIINDNIRKILRYNLGHTQIEGDELEDNEKETIKAMMNVKPDIAVIYRSSEDEHILFIECKFESYEDSYNGKNQNVENLSQCNTQYKVARFLCGYLNGQRSLSRDDLDYMTISPIMELDKKSRIVKFVRTTENEERDSDKKQDANKECNVGKISIKTLIDYNNKIFEENAENDG